MQRIRFFYSFLLVLIVLGACSDEKTNKESIPQSVLGGYEPMLNVLNQAIEEDPDDATLYAKRANLYLGLFYFKMALADAKKAIELDEQNPNHYLTLGKIQYELKNYVEAIKAAEKCEALNSNDVDLPVLQANIYFHLGDTVRLKKAMNKSEQLVPFHTNLILLKAKLAMASGDSILAVGLLRKSVSMNPKNLESIKRIATLYNNRGNDDSLMYYLMDMRSLANRDSELWYLEGSFYKRKNMVESAKRCFLNSIKLDSSFYSAYLGLADLNYKSGNLNEAKSNYILFTRYNQESQYVYKQLIEVVSKLESEKEVIPYYEKLCQIDSTNVQYQYTLARLYKLYNVPTVSNPSPAAPSPVPSPTPAPRPAPVPVPSPVVEPSDTTP